MTLLELLLSVAILGILMSLAIPAYQEHVRQSTIAGSMSDIKQIEQAIEQHRVLYNRYPDALNDIGGVWLDPWGNPYQYLNIQTTNNPGQIRKDHNLVPLNTDYDLYSMGANGVSQPPLTAMQSRDDIVRADNGRFVGLAADY